MVSSPSSRAAPQGAVSRPQLCGGKGNRQSGIPLPRHLRPVAAHRQQQSARHSHRVVGDQTEPQLRRRPHHGLQQLCGTLQRSAVQQRADLSWKRAVQPPRRHHQHWRPGDRIPQGVSRVAESGKRRGPPGQTHLCPHQLAPDALSRRRTKHHCQNQIGRGRSGQQHLCIHVRVEHAVHHRHAAPRHQAQGQHAPGHGTGDGEQQQRQPQQLCLSSIGRQRQQYACRQLHRRCGEKAQPRQKYRHGIGAPQQARQKVASPPEGNARQTRGAEHQQIVHQRVQHKHAVHIHHGQAIRLPSVPWDYYRADRREIRSQKGDAPCKKVRPPGSRLGPQHKCCGSGGMEIL